MEYRILAVQSFKLVLRHDFLAICPGVVFFFFQAIDNRFFHIVDEVSLGSGLVLTH